METSGSSSSCTSNRLKPGGTFFINVSDVNSSNDLPDLLTTYFLNASAIFSEALRALKYHLMISLPIVGLAILTSVLTGNPEEIAYKEAAPPNECAMMAEKFPVC